MAPSKKPLYMRKSAPNLRDDSGASDTSRSVTPVNTGASETRPKKSFLSFPWRHRPAAPAERAPATSPGSAVFNSERVDRGSFVGLPEPTSPDLDDLGSPSFDSRPAPPDYSAHDPFRPAPAPFDPRAEPEFVHSASNDSHVSGIALTTDDMPTSHSAPIHRSKRAYVPQHKHALSQSAARPFPSLSFIQTPPGNAAPTTAHTLSTSSSFASTSLFSEESDASDATSSSVDPHARDADRMWKVRGLAESRALTGGLGRVDETPEELAGAIFRTPPRQRTNSPHGTGSSRGSPRRRALSAEHVPSVLSPPFNPNAERATRGLPPSPLRGDGGDSSDDADTECSPRAPRRSSLQALSGARIPSMRFDELTMDTVFAEVQSKLDGEMRPLANARKMSRRSRVLSIYNVKPDQTMPKACPSPTFSDTPTIMLPSLVENKSSSSLVLADTHSSSSSDSLSAKIVRKPKRLSSIPKKIDIAAANAYKADSQSLSSAMVTPTNAFTAPHTESPTARPTPSSGRLVASPQYSDSSSSTMSSPYVMAREFPSVPNSAPLTGAKYDLSTAVSELMAPVAGPKSRRRSQLGAPKGGQDLFAPAVNHVSVPDAHQRKNFQSLHADAQPRQVQSLDSKEQGFNIPDVCVFPPTPVLDQDSGFTAPAKKKTPPAVSKPENTGSVASAPPPPVRATNGTTKVTIRQPKKNVQRMSSRPQPLNTKTRLITSPISPTFPSPTPSPRMSYATPHFNLQPSLMPQPPSESPRDTRMKTEAKIDKLLTELQNGTKLEGEMSSEVLPATLNPTHNGTRHAKNKSSSDFDTSSSGECGSQYGDARPLNIPILTVTGSPSDDEMLSCSDNEGKDEPGDSDSVIHTPATPTREAGGLFITNVEEVFVTPLNKPDRQAPSYPLTPLTAQSASSNESPIVPPFKQRMFLSKAAEARRGASSLSGGQISDDPFTDKSGMPPKGFSLSTAFGLDSVLESASSEDENLPFKRELSQKSINSNSQLHNESLWKAILGNVTNSPGRISPSGSLNSLAHRRYNSDGSLYEDNTVAASQLSLFSIASNDTSDSRRSSDAYDGVMLANMGVAKRVFVPSYIRPTPERNNSAESSREASVGTVVTPTESRTFLSNSDSFSSMGSDMQLDDVLESGAMIMKGSRVGIFATANTPTSPKLVENFQSTENSQSSLDSIGLAM